jgi:hypothetical protein
LIRVYPEDEPRLLKIGAALRRHRPTVTMADVIRELLDRAGVRRPRKAPAASEPTKSP